MGPDPGDSAALTLWNDRIPLIESKMSPIPSRIATVGLVGAFGIALWVADGGGPAWLNWLLALVWFPSFAVVAGQYSRASFYWWEFGWGIWRPSSIFQIGFALMNWVTIRGGDDSSQSRRIGTRSQ